VSFEEFGGGRETCLMVGDEEREDGGGGAEGFHEDGREFGEIGGDSGAGDVVEGGATEHGWGREDE